MTTFKDSEVKGYIRGLIFDKIANWLASNPTAAVEIHTLPAQSWIMEKALIAEATNQKLKIPLQLHCYSNDPDEYYANTEVAVPLHRGSQTAVKQYQHATVLYHLADLMSARPAPGCPSVIWADYCGHLNIPTKVEHLGAWAIPGNLIGVTFDLQWRHRDGNIPACVLERCPQGSIDRRARELNRYIVTYLQGLGVSVDPKLTIDYQGGRVPMFTGFYEIGSV